jgi:hypothetical protein
MSEAAGFKTGPQCRQLFATIICNHPEANAAELFEAHIVPLSDGVRRTLARPHPQLDPSNEEVRDFCILQLAKAIRQIDPGRASRILACLYRLRDRATTTARPITLSEKKEDTTLGECGM